MNNLFIDTSGWASLFVKTETYHPQATQHFLLAHQQKWRIVTTNYIIAELVALLSSHLRISRPQIFEIIDAIKSVNYIEIIHIDTTMGSSAWNLCKSRLDKTWSLVDCVSFVVMQEMKLQQVLTTDQHFEQAGFIRLLKA